MVDYKQLNKKLVHSKRDKKKQFRMKKQSQKDGKYCRENKRIKDTVKNSNLCIIGVPKKNHKENNMEALSIERSFLKM